MSEPGVIKLLATLVGLMIPVIALLGYLRLRGLIANLLAAAILGYAIVVVLSQMLSELLAMTASNLLLILGGLTLIALPKTLATLRAVAWRSEIWQRVHHSRTLFRQNPTLLLLSLAFLFAMTVAAYLILNVPPNTQDSMWYHLSRVAHWKQNQTLRHFATTDWQKITFPINAEISHMWLIILWGTDQLTGFVQWIAIWLTMLVIYGSARGLSFSRPASLFAALIWSSFTIVIAQASSTKNDITIAFFIGAALFFLLYSVREETASLHPNPPLMLFGLAIGLAVGTKTIALFVIPCLALMGLLLLCFRHRQYLPQLVLAVVWGLVGIVLVGSYNYLLNGLNYGSAFGPPELVSQHALTGYSLATILSNLGRLLYDFCNPGGLPNGLVDWIQQWRPQWGERIFNGLHIQPNPDELNWTGSFFTFDDTRPIRVAEELSWFGPLGCLLFLPTVLRYLFSKPWQKQTLWPWLTAVVTLAFFLCLAIFVRWRPYMGRFLLISVVMGAPLMAGFYHWSERYKPVRWFMVLIAITVSSWSALHVYDRPILGQPSILALDAYEQRNYKKPYLVPGYRYIDHHLPSDAHVGLIGDDLLIRWDYSLFGPTFERTINQILPPPERIDNELFTAFNLDYLLIATDSVTAINTMAPLWPVLVSHKEDWYLVKQTEADLFSQTAPAYAAVYGDDYQAYLKIRAALSQEPHVATIITTDPRMPYYDADPRFVFTIPRKLNDLHAATHLVVAPIWSAEDYARLQVSWDETASFLQDETFVTKLLDVHGYQLYRLRNGR